MSDNVNNGDAAIALEMSICGGSISIFAGGKEIDSWVGADDLSRSEDVPEILDTLLKRNRIDRERIGLIAVSVGLGSFTGTRIGLSTALGLKKALACRLVRVPLLRALAEGVGRDSEVLAAVSINKREAGWQVFPLSGDAPVPDVGSFSDFLDRFKEFADGPGISALSANVFEYARQSAPHLIGKNVRDAGGSLAKHVGMWAIKNPSDRNDQHVYSTGFRNSLP